MGKLLVLLVIGFFIWAAMRGRKQRLSAMTADEARAVLGVGPAARTEEVHAAYRRLTARVHPDAGGTPELARRVKTARDVLVAEISREPPATL